jgi:hypothetical protein
VWFAPAEELPTHGVREKPVERDPLPMSKKPRLPKSLDLQYAWLSFSCLATSAHKAIGPRLCEFAGPSRMPYSPVFDCAQVLWKAKIPNRLNRRVFRNQDN